MAADPKLIDTLAEGPINDLFLALNHYISTGDHIGEGVMLEDHEGNYIATLAYDPDNPDDLSDYHKLRYRISEVLETAKLELTLEESSMQHGRFTYAMLHIKRGDLVPLAQELVRSSGQAGWGTPKAQIDKWLPEVRAKILSGEGV